MKNKKGYLLIESIVALSIVATIILVLTSLLIVCIDAKTKIEDKVELQQQGLEISKHIKSTIEKSKGIIGIELDNLEEVYEDSMHYNSVKSIKCKYKDNNGIINTSVKNKEISLKKNTNKIFINTLNLASQSEPGGYEIGDYVECIYVGDIDDKSINIKLKLNKNNEVYETKFKVHIRNYEGGL
ncbi:Uncharacterised protein [uncultured Clostridium sp.]|nr:Uncharacterised protein [uncultured Clostridium sp.]